MESAKLVPAAISFVSLVVSAISLFKTSRVQHQQLRLQKKQEEMADLQIDSYYAERRVAIRADVADGELIIGPLAPDQQINNLTLYFPSKVGISPIALVAPNLRLALDRLTEPIRGYWNTQTPAKEGHAQVRPQVPLPVLIEAHGHAKGTAVLSMGAYDLYSEYVRHPDGSSKLRIIGLALNNHWPRTQDPQAAADGILEKIESAIRSGLSNPSVL